MNTSESLRLRGFITERLTTVASEILRAVEETLAAYEAEASGLRHELDLQKISRLQLALPRVKEEPTDDQLLFSLCETGGSASTQKEDGSTSGIKFENTISLKILSYSGGHEDEQLSNNDSEASSRLCPSADRVSLDGSNIRILENFVDLKICILKDWTIQELSDRVGEEYPIHELRCHAELREADFLKLLSSTFPPLASSAAFDSLIPDGGNRLQPLEVEAFTPEQICRAAGNSALYLRLKCPPEQEAGNLQQSEMSDDDDNFEGDGYDDDATPSLLQTSSEAENDSGTRPVGEQITDGPISINVRLLDDYRIANLSKSALKRSRLRTFQCPRGMTEADFLKLLKSGFHKLAVGRPFELMTTDETRRLFPLNAESLTPEKISAAVGSFGVYVRTKPLGGDDHSRKKNRRQKKADGDGSSSIRSQASPKNKNESQNKRQIQDTDTHINLRIHVLEDPKLEVVTSDVLRKYRLNKLECPRGMNEMDFLKLLRSTFPKLRAFETFSCDRSGKLLPLHVKSFTPELIYTAAGRSALYIRLKPGVSKKQREQTVQKNPDAARPASPRPATPSTRVESPKCDLADDKDGCITFRVCYLENVSGDIFSREGAGSFRNNPELFFKKFPIREVKCPRGLQERGFLTFLKTHFPHLDEDRPISVLALLGKKMTHLNLNNMVPEEIWKATGSVGTSVICIQQLKKTHEKEDGEPEEVPTKMPQTVTPQSVTPPTTPSTSVQPPAETPCRPPNSEQDNLVDLKICIVNDPSVGISSPLVLEKYPVVEFQCARSLKEAEFLDLLRSTFPQLAGETLDFLAGNDAQVKPIDIKNQTSDEISQNLRLAGNSFLCIQIKGQQEAPTGVKRSHSDVSDHNRDSPSNRVKKRRKRAKAACRGDEDGEDDETEDSEDEDDVKNMKSAKLLGLESLMSKYSVSSESGNEKKEGERPQKTSNQADDDATDDSEDESDKKPQFSRLSFLRLHKPGAEAEPEKAGKQERPREKLISVVEDEETEDSEDYDDDDGNESERSSLPSSSVAKKSSSDFPPKGETPKKVADGMANGEEYKTEKSSRVASSHPHLNSKEDANVSERKDDEAAAGNTSDTEMVEIVDSEEDDDNTKASWSSILSSMQSGQDSRRNNAAETADPSKRNDLNHSGSKPNSDNKPQLKCKVCKTKHKSRRILIRHAWKHVDHRDRPCGVCGKQFDSEESIKNHLQTHHTIHRCKICGKSFLLQKCFSGHMERHKGKVPEQKQSEGPGPRSSTPVWKQTTVPPGKTAAPP